MPQIKKNRIIAVLIGSALLALAGCSSPNEETGFDSKTGKHVENWYENHREAFLKDPSACTECHGTDLKGGISKVSCFSAEYSGMACHANGPSGHPAIWENPFYHGAAAKGAPGLTSGFSLCQTCHGSDFLGGLSLKSCLNTAGCHGANVNAPHAASWLPGDRFTHTTTDPGNAPVCALCHLSNRTPPSYATVPAGTTPGCFNSTLCHATPSGHPTGWANPDLHGATAKSAPTSTAGFRSCQFCHGNDFAGGTAVQTCLNTAGCHGANVNAPHSPKPWRGGTRTHTNTDPNNASVCAACHTNGANSSVQPSPPAPAGTPPDCFNNTLCHAAAVRHPVGWELPTAHGPSAKAAPSSSAGFSNCQTCHASDFTGGASLQTCLNTAGCHGLGVNAPHAAAWMPGDTYTHISTDQGNASVCALCHLGDRTPPSYAIVPAGTQTGCFNSTLCHAVPGHAAGWGAPSVHGASAKAAPNVATTSGFSTCQICHGSTFTGGVSNIACSDCHGTAPHPSTWRTATGTYTHTTTNEGNAAVCTLCHANGAISPISPPSPPAPAGTPPGCFNNTLCHGVAGHAAGWSAPTVHGASAKAAPNSLTMSGFSSCQPCHGNTFTGGVSTIVCSDCHGGSAPHPTGWSATGTPTHQTTNQGNATVCALCHTAGANSPDPPPSPTPAPGTPPGCMNGTLCHYD